MPSLRHHADAIVRTHWGLAAASVDSIDQGMNSEVVHVHTPVGRYILKVVHHREGAALRRGAEVATRLDPRRVRAGRPRATLGGHLTAATDHGVAALLAEVSGKPFEGDTFPEQRAMAHTLATLHQSLSTPAAEATTFGAWLVPTAERHPVEPWVLPTVRAVATSYAAVAPQLSTAWLHTDPAPEAFITGDPTGLIDWAGAEPGPRLYDVASAVMYLGGLDQATPFIAAYGEHSPELVAELTDHLELMLAVRYAVQAAYFAARVARVDLTGIENNEANLDGLAFAAERLASTGWLRS